MLFEALMLSLVGFSYVFAVFALICFLVYALKKASEHFTEFTVGNNGETKNADDSTDCDSEDDIEKVAAAAAVYYMIKKKSAAAVKPLSDNPTGGFSSWRQASIIENFEIIDICSKYRA